MDPIKVEEGTEEKLPLKQIRTFQGDAAEALRNQQESLVSIQRKEQARKEPLRAPAQPLSPEAKKVREFFMLFMGSLMLFVLGGVGAWYGYNEFVRKTAAPTLTAPANRFLSPNSEIELEVATTSREALTLALKSAVSSVPAGELGHIVLRRITYDTENEKPLVLTSEFLEMLQSRAPGSLVRALDPLFMFGALGTQETIASSTTTGPSPFLIIKLLSFENAYAGMLLWEKSLAEDLGPLFSRAEFLATLSADAPFRDITDRNKDIRMITNGVQPIIAYTFFDNNMLIISDRIETLRTLIERLTREKLSR
jgi:hypothetical protein